MNQLKIEWHFLEVGAKSSKIWHYSSESQAVGSFTMVVLVAFMALMIVK